MGVTSGAMGHVIGAILQILRTVYGTEPVCFHFCNYHFLPSGFFLNLIEK